jgi:hypothetical protein
MLLGITLVAADTEVKNRLKVYDQSLVHYDFSRHGHLEKLSSYTFRWQLSEIQGQVLKQGVISTGMPMNILMEFDPLVAGISLKLRLNIQIKSPQGYKPVLCQPLTVYSKQIFFGRIGKTRALLPDEEVEQLEAMGLKLEKLADFNGEEKLVFVEAKDYSENPDVLASLMAKGITLVMFAPNDETEIYLPKKKIREMRQIFSSDAKINGGLNVISNKEKITVGAASGDSVLAEVKYQKGKIIIVSKALRKALDKTPDAALMLIASINSNNLKQEKEQ